MGIPPNTAYVEIGVSVEGLSSLIARFKEAQSFNGSVVYEVDFNELFNE